MKKTILPLLILALALPSGVIRAASTTKSAKTTTSRKKTATKPAVRKTTKAVKTPTPSPAQATTPTPEAVMSATPGPQAAKKRVPAKKAEGEPAPGPQLKSLTGQVEVKGTGKDAWTRASSGDIIPAGSTLRCGAGARALLVFSNKSVVWVKEKTSLLIQERQSLLTRLQVLVGSVKIKVPHLKRKEKFEVESGGVVCGVRGTVLTLDKPEDKGPDVDVLFGEVKVNLPESLLAKLKETAKDEKKKEDGKGSNAGPKEDRLRTFTVTQGKGWSRGGMSLLTPERERDGIQDWTPGIPEEARLSAIRDDIRRRLIMRQYARQSVNTEQDVADSRDSQKEEDFAAGRTMTDVHGNLVRVDQRFTRPDLNSWEIVNMVKRTNYNFKTRNFAYVGSSGSRLDVMRARIDFNMRLPQTLNDIPGFVEKIDDLKVDRISVILGRLGDADHVFTVAYMGERPSLYDTGADDTIETGLYVGTLTTDPTSSATLKWLALKLDKASGVTFWSAAGLSHFMEPGSDSGGTTVTDAPAIEYDGAPGEFYSGNAKKWAEVQYSGNPTEPIDYTGNAMWLCNEQYFINSKGEIWTIGRLLSGEVTVRTFLEDMAGEVVWFAKNDDGSGTKPAQTDANFSALNPTHSNIDLVFTPDLIISIVKSLFNAASDVKDDTKTN